MNILLQDHLNELGIPANLRINDQINTFKRQCALNGCERPYHHFAFGQSPFSPPQAVIEALKENAHKHEYLPTAGLPELRQAIALYYQKKFNLTCTGDQVVVSPGSKEMISMILAAVEGTLIIPSPSWVSYLPQAKILKKDVLSIKLSGDNDYKLTPEQLEHAVEHTHTRQRLLILNNPNNPTGAVYSRDELQALVAVCEKYNIIVISDEIYARTSFDFDNYVSMGELYPEKTIVTGGLSKDRSAGGYRLGVGIFPQSPGLMHDILKIAGSTYSCVAAPIQYAALEAYSMNADIESYMDECTRIHKLVGEKTADLFRGIPGVRATVPRGAFYLYVDFGAYHDKLQTLGLKTCAEFCEHMLKVEHTAMLPGESLLLRDDDYGVRISYVDYDGDAVLAAWRRQPPTTEAERDSFFHQHCPMLVSGVANVPRYMEQVNNDVMPVHH